MKQRTCHIPRPSSPAISSTVLSCAKFICFRLESNASGKFSAMRHDHSRATSFRTLRKFADMSVSSFSSNVESSRMIGVMPARFKIIVTRSVKFALDLNACTICVSQERPSKLFSTNCFSSDGVDSGEP